MGNIKIEYYTAAWCGPCRAMVPVIEALRSEGWNIEKIDVDQERVKALENRIAGVPTFIVLRDGTPVHRFSGARAKIAMEQEFRKA